MQRRDAFSQSAVDSEKKSNAVRVLVRQRHGANALPSHPFHRAVCRAEPRRPCAEVVGCGRGHGSRPAPPVVVNLRCGRRFHDGVSMFSGLFARAQARYCFATAAIEPTSGSSNISRCPPGASCRCMPPSASSSQSGTGSRSPVPLNITVRPS